MLSHIFPFFILCSFILCLFIPFPFFLFFFLFVSLSLCLFLSLFVLFIHPFIYAFYHRLLCENAVVRAECSLQSLSLKLPQLCRSRSHWFCLVVCRSSTFSRSFSIRKSIKKFYRPSSPNRKTSESLVEPVLLFSQDKYVNCRSNDRAEYCATES